MMKLAAVVILYNPSRNVLENIMSYQGVVEKLIVIDNSEQPDLLLIRQLSALPNVEMVSRNKNTGISAALNTAAGIAINSGFKWLLTMDQDSSFENANLKRYRDCIDSIYDATDIGMIGVNYAHSLAGKAEESLELEETEILITSGSVVNLDIFQRVVGFDEKLFIDEVDSEYCYRLRKNGYKVYRVRNVSLRHELGKTILVRNWFIGPVVERNIHSPVRIYYMTRNFLYVYSKYKNDFKRELLRNFKIIVNRIKNAFLYSKGKRIQILFYIFSGVKDFLLGRYGQIK